MIFSYSPYIFLLGGDMEVLHISGGKKLNGKIDIVSSKNSLLPILAGSILTPEDVVIKKVPKFTDVLYMAKILENLGCDVYFDDSSLYISSRFADKYLVKDEFTKKVRSSIFMLGPLLARFKKAKVAYPGGCNIGNRPIDLHLKSLKKLNVYIEEKHGYIICDGSDMKASEIHLDFPSVGATENIMMASVFLKGTTTIQNAAKEPEIVDLQDFINSMGGKISGAGSSTITITGVDKLHETTYTPISDRIVTGTYLIACAMTGGNVTLNNVIPAHNLSLLDKLQQSGCELNIGVNNISIKSAIRPKSLQIETQVYPGFPTDLQNQILAMQTISSGSSVVIENLFESRYKICHELSKMGADIKIKDRMAIINGVEKLYGASVVASDLRGGAGLVLAGLVAEGYTEIENIHYIDRGYLSIEEDFCKLGGEIKRIHK